MADPTTTHDTERLTEQWKCTACGELWEIVQNIGDGEEGCPECRGPLRLISSPPSNREASAERALVALSDDHQWLVVHWSDYRTPWTVLQRLDEIDGYRATGDTYEDTGQNAADVLSAFLTRSRDRSLIHLEHAAAD